MQIGIIGAGNVGSSLGKVWAQNKHKLMFSYSRDPAKLEKIAQSIGSSASVGTPVKRSSLLILFCCRYPTGRSKMHSAPLASSMARFSLVVSMRCYRI